MTIWHAGAKLHPSIPLDVLRASSCVPSPLHDEQKERAGGRLKSSSILKILVVVKESTTDLKCLYSLFEYCRPHRIKDSESVTRTSEDLSRR